METGPINCGLLMVEEKGPEDTERERERERENLQGLDIMQLKDGFGGIRTVHVNRFYAMSLRGLCINCWCHPVTFISPSVSII